MIPSANYKKVRILITTYQHDKLNKIENDMNNENYNKKLHKGNNNKFVCAICLNSKPEKDEIEKKIFKACPICQKSCDYCKNNKKDKVNIDEQRINEEYPNVKGVQTSETDIAQGLNLLNEVLTVFQNKKVDIAKDKSKTSLFKDVGVSTDVRNNSKSNLTVSTFQYSIDETKRFENGKFTVLNSCQPIFVKKSHYSIDLIKHKSSSVPQMKMEELKYSLKEKTKSKDAIEEVNRMFATVRKHTNKLENSNRPLVRNGPRVLPVVKHSPAKATKRDEFENCQCCQTEHCMSSGDSFVKSKDEGDNDKCVYMVCCHYKNHHKTHTGVMICERCRKSDEYYCVQDNLNTDESS